MMNPNEHVCAICGGESSVYSARQVSASGFGYRLRRCGRCFFVQKVSEIPVEELYAQVYDAGGYVMDRLSAAGVARPERGYVISFWEELPKATGVTRVLEVGPGAGGNLLYLKDRGCEVATLDVSAWHNEYYRNQLRFDHVFAKMEDVPLGYFDAVLLTHVIEHVVEPVGFLSALRATLHPGGRLLCSTPNIHSLMGRVTGAKWWAYGVDDHFSFFSEATLGKCLGAAGYRLLTCATSGMNVAHSLSRYFAAGHGGPALGGRRGSDGDGGSALVQRSGKARLKARVSSMLESVFMPLASIGMGYELVVVAENPLTQ